MIFDESTDLLRVRREATPQRIAVRSAEPGDQFTYRELDQTATATARALNARASPEQTRIALALSTSPPFVVALYAALRHGWQVIPLNTALAPGELTAQIDRVKPDIVLCEQKTAPLVTAATGRETSILSVDERADGRIEPLFAETAPVEPAPHQREETALLLFTSGTTGDPKAVRLTLGNLVASAVASAFRLGVGPDDRWLCCLPMYHMGGLAPAIRSVLYGTELLLQSEFEATETAQLLETEQVTGVSLVPTQLKRLLDEGLEPQAVRTILLGGAPAAESLLDRARAASLPVYPTYGLTETASQVTTARPAESEQFPGTVGQPLLGTTVEIVEDGECLDAGQRGEIVVDGPTVTPGYLDADRTAEAFSKWGLHTGDVGYTDEDGRLWVLGRRDETIITGGELVSPQDVAETLVAVASVADAAVVGLDDPEWGERVGAVLVPTTGADSAESVRHTAIEYCREQLAGYKRPKTIAVAEEIPRTHSGTIDREAVRVLLRTEGVSDRDFS